jgi:hypothetical protein
MVLVFGIIIWFITKEDKKDRHEERLLGSRGFEKLGSVVQKKK